MLHLYFTIKISKINIFCAVISHENTWNQMTISLYQKYGWVDTISLFPSDHNEIQLKLNYRKLRVHNLDIFHSNAREFKLNKKKPIKSFTLDDQILSYLFYLSPIWSSNAIWVDMRGKWFTYLISITHKTQCQAMTHKWSIKTFMKRTRPAVIQLHFPGKLLASEIGQIWLNGRRPKYQNTIVLSTDVNFLCQVKTDVSKFGHIWIINWHCFQYYIENCQFYVA